MEATRQLDSEKLQEQKQLQNPLPTLSDPQTPSKSSASTSSSSSKSGAPPPEVDFVITFDVTVKSAAASGGNPKQKAEEVKALEHEYSNLIGVLHDAGLDATGRTGARGSDEILIFVRAKEERVVKEIHRERMSDWLNGVTSTSASPRTPRDFAASPISSSERLRLVYSILTSPRTGSNTSITSSSVVGSTAGLSPLPSPSSFPRVRQIFPLHDPKFNKKWLDEWSSRSHVLTIPRTELTALKDQFGETVALYFAFLRYYFFSLTFPAGIGLLFWWAGLSYHSLYALGTVLWSTTFVESWRLKERELAVDWGTHGVHNVEVQRPTFVGDCQKVDPVTGVQKACFPWYQTLARELASIPILLVFATVLAAMISTIYAIETIVGEVYDGKGKKYLTLVPTVLFAGLVPQVTALWDNVAHRLTNWENHEHETAHANSLTLKVFALNFFVAYGSLILTSYIYIPFGAFLVPHILSLIPSHHRSQGFENSTAYTINASKLHTQIVAYTLTNQITGAFVEVGVPFLTRLLTKKVAEVRLNATAANTAEADPEDEHQFLERVRTEATLPAYKVFADYSEMTVQFGYLTLFSVIWPIAPLWSFVNNFFELRSDAFKLSSQSQRPVPTREASIGPWLEVLGFITWLGALTNTSLVYLYRPHLSHSSKTSSLLSSVTGHSPNPLPTIQTTLFSALLVALATEHGYLIMRYSVRYILERVNWEGSDADVRIRGNLHELRKAYLDEMELRESPVKLAERSGGLEEARKVDADTETADFWKREDRGLGEIKRRGKIE
ncbi:DUF590-domain-containing protein [Meredithblackwellia eburnea MCA 4105]